MELIFGTHNNNKVEEIIKLLPSGYVLKSLTDLNFNTEIEESGTTLEENALIKATTIFNVLKKIVCRWQRIGGICFGRKPEYIRQDTGNQKNAKENTRKILGELKGVNDRRAQFRTVIAFILGGTEYLLRNH